MFVTQKSVVFLSMFLHMKWSFIAYNSILFFYNTPFLWNLYQEVCFKFYTAISHEWLLNTGLTVVVCKENYAFSLFIETKCETAIPLTLLISFLFIYLFFCCLLDLNPVKCADQKTL